MQALAIAYNLPESDLYQDKAVITALDKALTHWSKVKPSSTNWWENDIGVNLRFSRIGLFLEHDLSETSMNVIINNLNKEGKYHGTGQNNLWYDQNAIYRALITNDAIQLKKVIEECLEYVLILQTDNVTKEALQVDNSLYFHGIQFYSNGYGLSMFRDMSFWIYMLDNTEFALSDEVVKRMGDYMLDGTRWTLRSDIMELYLGYRPYKYDVGFENYAEEYLIPLERMASVDLDRSHEYQVVLDNLLGKRNDNGLEGNNYMWRVGYGSHMRKDYGVNVKMDSKRIIGGEWRGSWPKGEDGGNSIIWSASASSAIVVDGDEYTPIYPTFDWAHVPGVTSPNFVPKNYSNYGRVNNNDDHALGVSNGVYGSTSYKLNKSNTQANKSYFFFDDEFVALGSGIKSTGTNPVHTTLNQSKAENVYVDGKLIDTNTKEKQMKATWLHNDDIAYIFPKETDVVINNYKQDMPSLWSEKDIEATPETFSAWVDHGVKPTEGSYEYIVVPNIDKNDVDAYMDTNEIEILSNTSSIHAVKHHGLKITQINFFEPGTLEYAPGKSITVDKKVNLIIDESSDDVLISIAMTDISYNERISVVLKEGNKEVSSDIVLYPAPYTGKTISFRPGESNEIQASSEIKGHEAVKAFDKDMNTYWESEKESSAWIQKSLGDSKYVNTIEINWGDKKATKYKIQGSLDGHNFFDLDTQEKDELIIVNEIISYVRVQLLDGNNDGSYSIKEISIDYGTNIALNKKVEVSSTSKTDTGNIASLLNDGNASSRWSSSRDSNEEWIILDLQGKAEISAINILWEAAKSENYTIQVSDDKKEWTTIQSVNQPDSLLDSFTYDEKVTGRYLKINSTKSKTPKYGISIFELEIYGNVELQDDKRINLALNKDSKASSEFVNRYTGFVLESKYAFDNSKAADGDKFQSRWVSDRESADEWIMVDLGDTYLVDEIVLDWEGAYASEYKLLVSNNNKVWTEVYHDTKGKAGVVEIPIEPIQARYVKMQAIKYATKYGYSLWEFEVYGEEIPPVNIALDKETKSSSNYINPKNKFEHKSAYAVDGSLENRGDTFQSRWVSNRESDNEWIEINLEDMYQIDKIVLNWEASYGAEYLIQTSNNGTDWENLVHEENGKAGIVEYEVEDTIAQYVRMQGIKVATKYGYSLWEFEVYGEKTNDEALETSQLETLISKALELKVEDYTHNEFNKLQTLIIQAQALLNDANASQADVDALVIEINNKFNELELRDDAGLKSLVDKAKLKVEKDYTKESFDNLQSLLSDAETLLAEGANTNADYISMEVKLQESLDALVNISLISGYLDFLEALDLSSYTQESIDLLMDVVEDSKELLKQNLLTQEMIDEQMSKLEEAIKDLELKDPNTDVNTDSIRRLLEKAKAFDAALYTVDSYHVLEQEMSKTEVLLLDTNVNQIVVDNQERLLQGAIDGLVQIKLNTENLKVLIEKVDNLDLTAFTKDSVDKLNTVLDKALEIVKDPDNSSITQADVDKVASELESAINALVKEEVPVIPEEPEIEGPEIPEVEEPETPGLETPETEDKDQGVLSAEKDKLPKTGSINPLLYISSAFILLGLSLLIYKRKQKQA